MIKIFLISIASLLHWSSFSQNPWKMDKNEEGIAVYTKIKENSRFKSFKGVMTVQASIDDILKILKNADEYSSWYGYTKTSKLLKKVDEVQYNYVETIFPWPYSNRDMVYKLSTHMQSNGAVKVSIIGIPDYIPEKRGIERLKEAGGHILLEPLTNKTKITYQFHSEPGDTIPSWLANKSISELPFKTLSGLRTLLIKQSQK